MTDSWPVQLHSFGKIGVALFLIALGAWGVGGSGTPVVLSQTDYSRPPINYHEAIPTDRVAELANRLTATADSWKWDPEQGWLPDLLRELAVPTASQTLVFSKTSLQIQRIRPDNPRAIYFSDDVYVGYVPGGDLIEISAVDPQLGAVFYTLKQTRHETPRIVRDQHQCLSCHATAKTADVPGYLIRSVRPGVDGHPLYQLGTTTVDDRTPMQARFGGWLVTSQLGDGWDHLGNRWFRPGAEGGEEIPRDPATGWPENVPSQKYPFNHSDAVALLLLEHQSQIHNRLTFANYETRLAIAYEQVMNEALGRPRDHRGDSTTRRIQSAAEKLVDSLLFAEAAAWPSPLSVSPQFRDWFSAAAVRDPQGRSLRDLNLTEQLLEYPCSYLIYSPGFQELPADVQAATVALIQDTLRTAQAIGDQDAPSYQSFRRRFPLLTSERARAIQEILAATHPLFRGSPNSVED